MSTPANSAPDPAANPTANLSPNLDHTHVPAARSFVIEANDPANGFPIQNLPYCSFSISGSADKHLAVRIGDHLLDLSIIARTGAFHAILAPHFAADPAAYERVHSAFDSGNLIPLCDSTPTLRKAIRHALFALLSESASGTSSLLRDDVDLRARALIPVSHATLHLTHTIGDYTDFYASIHHATTVGTMFRPDNALLPNYKWVPIGYHGRASSIIPSGSSIRRPSGQIKADDAAAPTFGPSKLLDYELEVGMLIARGNALGSPISIATARNHIFGFVIVNDWSARDFQKWEYQPLGPFLAKNFATTLSPYVVTAEALEPFRIPASSRPDTDPAPLPYLANPADQALGGFDISLEVALQSAAMRTANTSPQSLSRGSFRDMYWTFAQILTHHASNGCNLTTGDLLASGTISGPTPQSRGCLLELTWDGLDPITKKPLPRKPIQLPTGELRTFLADGDRVIFRATCARNGYRTISFGECDGTILPAIT